MSESSSKSARERILNTLLPQYIEMRLREVLIFNAYYLTSERNDPSPMMAQEVFEWVFGFADIVHGIWDDKAARLGTGTMLLQGEDEFCSTYGLGIDSETMKQRRDQIIQFTIRVPDEGAARELKRLFGNGTATLRPGEVARMRFCIDRRREDGTTFRQTIHVMAEA